MIRAIMKVGRMLVVSSLAIGSSWIVSAQTVDVTLRGVVVDETRAAIPGVTVTATNIDTGLSRQAITHGGSSTSMMSRPERVVPWRPSPTRRIRI